MSAKIAVIGAGPSGLATLKELLEAGHQVTCFDQRHDIGGVFSEGGTYDSLQLTVSNYFMAFSDFMPYGEEIRFWTRAEYKAYLDDFARRFELRSRIQLGVGLRSMVRAASGQWELELERDDGSTERAIFDRVAVCSGQFQAPNVPDIPGLDRFEGRAVHSYEYRNPQLLDDLSDQRVLCLGMGESAADVVTEIAEVARSTTLSLRRRHVFSERWVGPHPIDVVQSRSWHALPARTKAESVRRGWRQTLQHTDRESLRALARHVIAAPDEPGSVVTKTGRIFEAEANGMTVDIGGVRDISGSTVTFNSGRVEDFDVIVFCTGFKFSLPFLPAESRFDDIRECYLHAYHPELRDEVVFIGFVRPQQGGVPVMAELQARHFALVASGALTLPPNLAERAKRDAERWRAEFYETPEVFGLVNGFRFNEQIAELIGCRLPEPSPLTSPREFMVYWFHHVWPSQYRLVGPGARPEARAHWLRAPSVHQRGGKIPLLDQLRLAKSIAVTRVKASLTRDPMRRWRPIFDPRG